VRIQTDSGLVGLGKYEHITPVLHDLHWLPVPQKILFKIVFDCVRARDLPTSVAMPVQSLRIQAILVSAHESRGLCLRLAERGDLFVPRTRTTVLGRRSFFIVAPVVWNSLPLHLRSHPSVTVSQWRNDGVSWRGAPLVRGPPTVPEFLMINLNVCVCCYSVKMKKT